jgi:hypothetical protein
MGNAQPVRTALLRALLKGFAGATKHNNSIQVFIKKNLCKKQFRTSKALAN